MDLLALADGPVTKSDLWLETKSCIWFFPHKIDYLDDYELNYLMCSYSTFPEGVDVASGTVIFDHYASVEFCDDRYGSLDSRSERSSYVIASWVGIYGSIDPATVDAPTAIVHYYLKHNIVIHGELKSIVMAVSLGFRSNQIGINMKVVSQRFGARMFSSHLGLHRSFQCKGFNVSSLEL